jgi:hypothetical protein
MIMKNGRIGAVEAESGRWRPNRGGGGRIGAVEAESGAAEGAEAPGRGGDRGALRPRSPGGARAGAGSRSARRGQDAAPRGRWHGTPTAQARAPVAQSKPKGRIDVIVRRGRRCDNRFPGDWMIMH